jgi:hypothetical protein
MVPWSVRFSVRLRKLSNVWSVIGWVTKNLLSRAPCFRKHVKPLVPYLRSLEPTNQHWAREVGYGPFFLCVIHKEGLCPSSGALIGWMMIMMIKLLFDFSVPDTTWDISKQINILDSLKSKYL